MEKEIVIKIEEETYNQIMNGWMPLYKAVNLIENVQKGTPLPEHHGRLIDADELYGDFIDGTEGYDCQTWNRIEIGDIIEDTLTIIERSDSE